MRGEWHVKELQVEITEGLLMLPQAEWMNLQFLMQIEMLLAYIFSSNIFVHIYSNSQVFQHMQPTLVLILLIQCRQHFMNEYEQCLKFTNVKPILCT